MNRTEFNTLVESTMGGFRRFLTTLCCGDSQMADDIAQDAYVKAYLAGDQLSDVSKFKAWLYRIGYNLFLDGRRKSYVTEGYEAVTEQVSSEKADSGFTYQELYEALGHLSGTERTSILLYYMEGYSIKEISELECTTSDAVKQHLSRGRRHLRKFLTL